MTHAIDLYVYTNLLYHLKNIYGLNLESLPYNQ